METHAHSALAVALTVVSHLAFAAPVEPPAVEWEKVVEGQGRRWFLSVEPTSDGGYVAAGAIDSGGSAGGVIDLLRTDEHGGIVWEKAFLAAGGARSFSVQQTNDGGYIVGGRAAAETGDYPILLKTDGTGALNWKRRLGHDYMLGGAQARETKDGGYVLAWVDWTDQVATGRLARMDAQGEILWEKSCGDFRGIDGLVATEDGGFVVAGFCQRQEAPGLSFKPFVHLVKTDSEGEIIWEKTLGSGHANSVQQTSEGGYILVGGTDDTGWFHGHLKLIKLNEGADLVWESTLEGEGNSRGWAVEQIADGGYIAAGARVLDPSSQQSGDVLVVKFHEDGQVGWEKTLGSTADDQWRASVRRTQDGGYIVLADTAQGVRLIKLAPDSSLTSFQRGDSNGDGAMDISDPVAILNHLFGTKALPCLDAADVDSNAALELTDAVRLLAFLFLDSEPLEAPFRQCGPDLDAGALTCERYEPCE